MKYNKYIYAGIFIGIICGVGGITSCHDTHPVKTSEADHHGRHTGFLQNYSDTGLERLAYKLKHSDTQKTHIVFIGDSHTAADFFSGGLRKVFQNHFGFGGTGFISPVAVPGNRFDNVTFEHTRGMHLLTSRSARDPNFTLGGNIVTAVSNRNSSDVVLRGLSGKQQVQALYLAPAGGQLTLNNVDYTLAANPEGWTFSPPATVERQFRWSLSGYEKGSAIAGFMLSTTDNSGVMLSALGINGAQITMLEKWQNGWVRTLKKLSPDMVILSYGTNEAFNTSLSLEEYRQTLQRQIRTIHQAMPEVAMLLIGPGSSIMNKKASGCHERQSPLLEPVISVQQQLARQEHILFWDWFTFMGGECSIERWAAQGKARPDLIHLSAQGYHDSASALFDDLLNALDDTTTKR